MRPIHGQFQLPLHKQPQRETGVQRNKGKQNSVAYEPIRKTI